MSQTDEVARLKAENARLRALVPAEQTKPEARPRSGPKAGRIIRQQIVDYLRTGDHTVPEIAEHLQIAHRTCYRQLHYLLSKKEIRRTILVGKDLPHVWSHRDNDETRSTVTTPAPKSAPV